MSNNAHELSNRLLNALDNNYNVVDMHTVNEIISVLERINITKELLETTRLGKHVNELRRKTADPSLARRAKVLVKRWRDLVIPTVASPAHTGSNRSSAERAAVRSRLGGTPLTSPALSRQVVSPAVNSPRPPSRPAWGGYESDSQDVILVDDEPAPPLPAPPPPPVPSLLAHTHKPLTPPVKRPPSPEPLFDEKKAKRDKKPKKKRGHSRAGSGTEATGPVAPAAPVAPAGPPALAGPPAAWGGRNGTTHERRRNGTKRDALDSYAALVNRMPPAGAKKVKTTKELLEQIQSRGSKPAASPGSPRSPASPDVMLIEPDTVVKVDSPLRNGASTPRPPSPPASPSPPPSPLEEPRAWHACTCGDVPADTCPAAAVRVVRPRHVHALHHAHVPGVNGTRAPALPHRFAVRPAEDPDRPGLFASVVPLYKYSDYADDYCAKNLSRVQLCPQLPWTSFAPPPPDLPPPPEPPPLRPYPEPDPEPVERDEDADELDVKTEIEREPVKEEIEVEAEMVGVPTLEPSERLKAPILMPEDETSFGVSARAGPACAETHGSCAPQHRSVPRTKEQHDAHDAHGGAALVAAVRSASCAVPHSYAQLSCAPVLPRAALDDDAALCSALAAPPDARDALGRPEPAPKFSEWHECATLGSLVALPYVVID